MDEAGQIPSNLCVGWSYREPKKSHDKTYFLFFFRLTPTCLQAALIGLTGAEKDSLWYFVFVKRDQQARTGSLRSSADRQAMK